MTRRIEDFSDDGKRNRERQRKYRAAHSVSLWWKSEFAKLSKLPTPPPVHQSPQWCVVERLAPDGSPEAARAARIDAIPAGWQRSTVLTMALASRLAHQVAAIRQEQIERDRRI